MSMLWSRGLRVPDGLGILGFDGPGIIFLRVGADQISTEEDHRHHQVHLLFLAITIITCLLTITIITCFQKHLQLV